MKYVVCEIIIFKDAVRLEFENLDYHQFPITINLKGKDIMVNYLSEEDLVKKEILNLLKIENNDIDAEISYPYDDYVKDIILTVERYYKLWKTADIMDRHPLFKEL